jgi:hypothetical protein
MGLIRQEGFDAFFSYAHADNGEHDVTYLHKALQDHVRTALKAEQARLGREAEFFIDREGMPANGGVSAELMSRVGRSAFLFICVGRHYADSDWCLDELTGFLAGFNGNLDEAAKRIFVVVLEEEGWERLEAQARAKLQAGPHREFQQLLGQLRTQLYDEHGTLKAYLPVQEGFGDSAEAVPNARYASVRRRLVSTLEHRIRVLLPGRGGAAAAAQPAATPAPDRAFSPARPRRVLVGVITPDLEAERAQLVAALTAKGIATDLLEPADLTRQDFRQMLRERAAACGAFVLPYSRAPVLVDVLTGGHLAIQSRAVDGAVPLVWWRSGSEPGAAERGADRADRESGSDEERFFAAIDVRARTGRAADIACHVEGLFAPAGGASTGKRVRVFIESSESHKSEWEEIGHRIRSHWSDLAGVAGAEPPAIDCDALPFVDRHSLAQGALKDSHLIIVLWGENKAFDSLDAQVRLLAKDLSSLGADTEVSVAPLVPPRPENISSVDVIRFSVPFRREHDGLLREIDGERLRTLLRRALERASRGPAPARAA